VISRAFTDPPLSMMIIDYSRASKGLVRGSGWKGFDVELARYQAENSESKAAAKRRAR
jgi:hypothetical protein